MQTLPFSSSAATMAVSSLCHLVQHDLLPVLAPTGVERAVRIEPAVGVRTKIIAQPLQQICWPPRAAQPVIIAERGRKGRDRDAMPDGQRDDAAPRALRFQHGFPKVVL